MSEMDNVKNYLKKIVNQFDRLNQHPILAEYHKLAESVEIKFETDDLLHSDSLDEPYKGNHPQDRSAAAGISKLALLIKAKKYLKSGEIQKTIETLFHYYLLTGKLHQNFIEEHGFKAEASRRTTPGRDKRYYKNRNIRDEACKLLHTLKPQEGWKNKKVAAKAILPELKTFFKKDNTKTNLTLDNIDGRLDEWIKDNKNEVANAFIETASQEWIKKYSK